MKKLLLVLVVALLATALVPASAAKLDWTVEIKATPEMYPGVDMSKNVTLYMVIVGDKPEEYDMVKAALDEYIAPFNVTLDITFLSWSDHPTMYPLLLTGGDQIDICYVASGWCHLWTEAAKGNFYVLTEEFIEEYMPLHAQYQDPASWEEAKYQGEIVACLQNYCPTNSSLVAIREDLRVAYDLPVPVDYQTYKEYLLGVAAHTAETGLIALNCDKSEGVWSQYTRGNRMNLLPVATDWRYTYADGALPTVDQITYVYQLPAYRDYLDEAKELCDAGVWSRSALNKTETLAQSFGNGTSAAMQWNFTIYQYMELAEQNGDVETMGYDLWPDGPHATETYNNSGLAIYAGTKYPYHAAMMIDVIKWDTYICNLLSLGIEGHHYTNNGDGTYSPIEENTKKFGPDSISLAWVARKTLGEVYTDARERDMIADCDSRTISNVTAGFIFDTAPVAAYKAAVDAARDEYRYTLGLGFFDDAEVAYGDFMDALNAAGIEALNTELANQYTAWYELMVG